MNLRKAVFYILAGLLGGCVPSLHPLYTDTDTVFDEKIIGSWQDADSVWKFEKAADANSYDLTVITDGKEGRFIAHLVRLNDTLFFDLYPGHAEINASDFYKAHLLGAHSFLKVEQIEPNLALRMMDPENFEKLVESEPEIIKHEVVEKRIILTASTPELQKFVLKYQNDPNVFAQPSNMTKVFDDSNEPNLAEPNLVSAEK
ncbi:MAG: hypothetical protein WDA68_03485 [Phycisphaerae bacterium]